MISLELVDGIPPNFNAWIYHWDKLKSWVGFGDLDLIFKVIEDLSDNSCNHDIS